jgi:hypothetical protein
VGPGVFTANQIHDYEPGIQSNGVFWTVAVPPSALAHDLGAGTASFKLTDYALKDWINFPQSLAQGTSFPAVVSFDLRFLHRGPKHTLRKDAQSFVYDFNEMQSTITWQADQDTFSFVSDPADPSKSLYASLGHHRNGVFFAQPAGATTTSTSSAPPPAVAAAGSSRDALANTGGRDRRSALAGAAALGAAVVLRRLTARD